MEDAFHKGWSYYTKASSTGVAANTGRQYCTNVQGAIDTFTEEMQSMVEQHGNLGVGQCKGFVAESWHANTFNVNAALQMSKNKAFVDQSTDLGSVDVSTNFGRSYSMKYIADAKKSANAQAKNYYENYFEYLKKPRKGDPMPFEEYLQKYGIENNPEELFKSVYNGQYRVIPKDQLDDAIKYLEMLKKIEEGKDGVNRAFIYENYAETLRKLTDRISDGEGVESIPLDKESAEVIVQLCRDGEFNSRDFGIDITKLITTDYILQQALKAGYTTAAMSLVMEISPKVCDALFYLIKNGEVDPQNVKEIGFSAIKGPAMGFVRGYISCALTIACNSGKLGEQFMGIQGNVVAVITVLVMNTIKNAWLVTMGKMTAREMEVKTEDGAIVVIAALIGGKIGITLLPELAVLGYMIGSFVGSVVGSLVAKGKNTLIIALCANTGITLFGIVDQDYSLSKEMITKLGLGIVELDHLELSQNVLNHTQLSRSGLGKNELRHIDFFTLRRGVIGARRIGYI